MPQLPRRRPPLTRGWPLTRLCPLLGLASAPCPHSASRSGRRLRELRGRCGWSQAHLAARAGLCGKFLGEVERGEKSISLDGLAHLARALRMPLGALVKGLEPRKKARPVTAAR